MTPVQRDIYAAIVAKCALMRDKEGDAKTDAAVTSGDKKKALLNPLHTLIALRQLVDHPMLVHEVLAKVGWSDLHTYNPSTSTQVGREPCDCRFAHVKAVRVNASLLLELLASDSHFSHCNSRARC